MAKQVCPDCGGRLRIAKSGTSPQGEPFFAPYTVMCRKCGQGLYWATDRAGAIELVNGGPPGWSGRDSLLRDYWPTILAAIVFVATVGHMLWG